MEAARVIGVPLLVDATPAMLAAAETRLQAGLQARAARDRRDRPGGAGRRGAAAGDLAAVGKLLLASHRSSRTWFENSSPELDFLVDSLESEKGVYGAG
jgi:galactokinase